MMVSRAWRAEAEEEELSRVNTRNKTEKEVAQIPSKLARLYSLKSTQMIPAG